MKVYVNMAYECENYKKWWNNKLVFEGFTLIKQIDNYIYDNKFGRNKKSYKKYFQKELNCNLTKKEFEYLKRIQLYIYKDMQIKKNDITQLFEFFEKTNKKFKNKKTVMLYCGKSIIYLDIAKKKIFIECN